MHNDEIKCDNVRTKQTASSYDIVECNVILKTATRNTAKSRIQITNKGQELTESIIYLLN